MLNIFVGKESIKDRNDFIFDVEGLVFSIDLTKDAFSYRVVEEIEEGRVQDKETFFDRFNRGLFKDCLSTTSKILLAINQTPFIVNGVELGVNGLDLLMQINDGNVFFPSFERDIQPVVFPITVNGIIIQDADSFEEKWGML